MYQCPMKTYLYTIRPGDSLQLIAHQYNTSINAITAANSGIDFNNLYVGQVICIRYRNNYYNLDFEKAPMRSNMKESDLKDYLRMLWEQHVVWTRLTILSMVFNLPDVDLVTNRLLRNPKDFETALRHLYGDKVASKTAELFKDHLVIAAQLVKAAKAGDNKAVINAENRWYANADAIAAFLGNINPYWSEKDWRTMMHEHLSLTKAEAVSMLKKNYAESITLFDEIEKQALKMAYVMAYGIIKQFPNKFAE
jgi:hypothetical protein